jgi:hypothetical protein
MGRNRAGAKPGLRSAMLARRMATGWQDAHDGGACVFALPRNAASLTSRNQYILIFEYITL